ncbi:tyrosine-type recombinase/integrase [Bifidobacterium ruminantium]|uniref:tyrosine-type recombinase/integrase n=1 Tax=Bifidobacterium ruminantium TaxID=78346 RepID=UPI00249182F7|nr:site-specific integrase [Bifidobacterium ruminantium]
MEDGTRKKRHGRRRWGTVIKRKDDEGQVIAYVARYVSPLDKNKKIGKQFKPEYEAQAYEWLDEEHYLVILHNKGIKQWTPPNERDKRKTDSLMTFEEWTRAYFNRYKEKNGQMRGRTMRRTKLAVNRLMPYFRTMPLNEITENEVARWRRKAKKEIPSPDGYEKASFMLKRLMNAAVKEGLKVENPCKYSLTRSKPKKEDIRPLDKNEINVLADAFPEYTRLAVWLSVLVGGLRIGEVCGLQLRDLDLENGLLYVRHSVDRGTDDCGPYELCPPKTRKSERVLPVSSILIPMIRKHIERFCPVKEPDSMLFTAVKGGVLPPPTLQAQFRVARRKVGRDDISFHTLRATHATLYMIHGGTLRETMNELGHHDINVAIGYYQRVVPEHQREVAERLASDYLPMEDTEMVEEAIGEINKKIEQLQARKGELETRLESLGQRQPHRFWCSFGCSDSNE